MHQVAGAVVFNTSPEDVLANIDVYKAFFASYAGSGVAPGATVSCDSSTSVLFR